ncbi:DUF6678 family protein [Qipengyuania sp. DGS5-3]|uniref:DUF6678 family protein n=1 Tax=Qipengyuania sp. DGS5-3 TaxID=3349632 RepID=UPI0036D3298F
MMQLDHKKEGKLARENFRSAFMSDTKWRKLFNAIEGQDIQQMNVKFIDVPEPRTMNFPPWLDCHYAYMDSIEFGPVELRSIEWLELPMDIEPLVSSLGKFPLERTETGTRIIGYKA